MSPHTSIIACIYRSKFTEIETWKWSVIWYMYFWTDPQHMSTVIVHQAKSNLTHWPRPYFLPGTQQPPQQAVVYCSHPSWR